MKEIKDQSFGGERPLFAIHDTRLVNVTITEGESGIKHCSDIEAIGCTFIGKYPFWHVDRSLIKDCLFEPGSRSAVWYSDDMRVENTIINAPKLFREQKNLEIVDVQINDADETFWKIKNLKVKNLKLHDGTYPFMFSEDIYVDGLESDSKYVFQYVKNCHITGEQPLCYAHDLVLENCTFGEDCDRAFEYSTLQADIRGGITNIKNPTSGRIVADKIGSVTIDENVLQPNNCEIVVRS